MTEQKDERPMWNVETFKLYALLDIKDIGTREMEACFRLMLQSDGFKKHSYEKQFEIVKDIKTRGERLIEKGVNLNDAQIDACKAIVHLTKHILSANKE